jgi:hypothetical protein
MSQIGSMSDFQKENNNKRRKMGSLLNPIKINLLESVQPTRWFRLGHTTIPFPFTRGLHLMLTLPDDSQVSFVLQGGLDAGGNPAPLTVAPTVTVSDTTILTLVQPDPATPSNPLSGVISAAGALGTAQLVIADADPTAGNLTVLVDITVIASALVSLQQPTFGPIVPKVVPVPVPAPVPGP